MAPWSAGPASLARAGALKAKERRQVANAPVGAFAFEEISLERPGRDRLADRGALED
jgi:hypothetical protein